MMSFFRRTLFYTIFSSMALFACFAGDSFSARIPLYASSSNLSSGTWVKVSVKKEGMYKITFDELKALGFSNPKNVRVFGYGGQLLPENLTDDYLDDIPEVCSYLGDNYILFYGVGTLKQELSKGNNRFSFTSNTYSDYGCYFLSDVSGKRKEISNEKSLSGTPAKSLNTHYAYGIYLPQTTNIYKGGIAWYDDGVQQSNSTKISLPFSNMVPGNNGIVSIYTDAVNATNPSFTVSGSDFSFSAITKAVVTRDEIPQSDARSIDFNVTFNPNSASSVGYIHYLSASVLCYNKLDGGYLCFNNQSVEENGELVEMVLAGADSETQVWNVTKQNEFAKVKGTLTGDSLRFNAVGGAYAKYVAFNPKGKGFLSVEGFAPVVNQNLHGFKGADLIILSPVAHVALAQRLAELHIKNDGISAAVFTQEQVFNEFSSGTPDPTAIRSFMKMLYDKAQDDEERVAPRYLLLFGDGCFDNRGLMSSSYSSPRNLVLCYQRGNGSTSIPADDYYGMLADNDAKSFSINNSSCQVAVGRLPFVTAAQAEGVVAKIEAYMKNDQLGAWKSKACIIADDNEGKQSNSSYNEFVSYGEGLSKIITKACPSIVQRKVYHDSYNRVAESSGNRYPEVEKLILENVNKGSMLINYIGHSNAINWAAEKTFTQSQVASLTNKKLGVWFSASCEFSEYDNYTTSCGESLVLAPNGGAIAVVATPRLVYAYDNDIFDKEFCRAFFSQTPDMTIGDVMVQAKNQVLSEIRVKYPLLGDPALHINFPTERVFTDSISLDTANALSKVKVFGHIEGESGKDAAFNGRVMINVYDKEQVRSTKGNYTDSNGNPMKADFSDYPSVLFSGSADVVNGEFNFEFVVPNDISYNYGFGRITYYAYDEDDKVEAIGNYNEIVIGGSLDYAVVDTVGPKILAYINTPSFRSGDVVGSNPVFVAHISDENGINASNVGVGHDITLSLNGSDPVALNENFAYTVGSCTDGTVTYKLSNLPDGVYTLYFKVWDLLNNSSTRSVSFEVKNEKAPHIDAVSAFPNPAVNETNILVKYDRPLSNVDYVLSIFDSNGRFVNVLTGSENSDAGLVSIPWNLKTASGHRVEPGIYIYRVELKTDDSVYVGSADKIIVLPK